MAAGFGRSSATKGGGGAEDGGRACGHLELLPPDAALYGSEGAVYAVMCGIGCDSRSWASKAKSCDPGEVDLGM